MECSTGKGGQGLGALQPLISKELQGSYRLLSTLARISFVLQCLFAALLYNNSFQVPPYLVQGSGAPEADTD